MTDRRWTGEEEWSSSATPHYTIGLPAKFDGTGGVKGGAPCNGQLTNSQNNTRRNKAKLNDLGRDVLYTLCILYESGLRLRLWINFDTKSGGVKCLG